METTNTFSRMALRVMVVMLTGLLTTQLMVAQGWYDTDWPYRSAVAVSNPGSTELSDFQVKITLTSSNFNFTPTLTDGSDIRVTSGDGTTLIPFWLESWNKAGLQATIWVKVPSIPISGTSVYIYYGNASPTIPPQVPVATPPIGPFTKYTGNPITVPGLCSGNILPENLVYDGGKYWIIISNRCTTPCPLSLISSTDLINWVHEGVILSASDRYFDSPCLVQANNTWYIFYSNYDGTWSESNPAPIGIAKSTSGNIMGPYTELNRYILTCGTSPSWDDARVSEPYVIQRDNGDWVMVYMGDADPAGGFTEQVGIAVSTTGIEGTYTKSSGNPVIAFGPTGSLDAGTIADPWVVKFGSTYYIGYTASPSKSNWNTTYATTTDWSTFTKSNTVILNQGPGAYDQSSAFRGAVTRVGDNYLFPYTAQGSGGFQFAYATQPVNVTPPNINNNVYGVFEFYDGFDSTALNTTKWNITGSGGSATVSSGILTVYTASSQITLTGNKSFGPGMLLESSTRHPDANGAGTTASELGFGNAARTDVVRIFDYAGTRFLKQAYTNGQGNVFDNFMNYNLNSTDYLLHRIFWRSSSQVDYALENIVFEPITSNIPSMNLPPWLFCVALGRQATLMVDWIRVRKWVGSDAGATVGSEQFLAPQWTGAVSTDWNISSNWNGGVPQSFSLVTITSAPIRQPHITGTAASPSICNNLTISTDASLTIDAGKALTVGGNLTNNGTFTIESSALDNNGSLIVNGTSIGNVTYNRIMPVDKYRYISSPVSSTTFPSGTFWRWNEPLGAWGEDIAETPTTACSSGVGYTMLATGTSVAFTGSVVNALEDVPATAPYNSVADHYNNTRGTWGGGGWNLLGNPFTCALDGSAFISTNGASMDASYQAIYIYNGTDYYYIASGTPGYPGLGTFSGTDVQAGQGFFVLANYNGVTFDFTSGMRKHNTTAVMTKSASTEEAWPGLQLKVKYGDKENSTLIVYNENMTAGLDPGYDIGLLSSGLDGDIYTTLAGKDNDVNFTRQALPAAGADTIIVTLGIDTEQGGEVTFSAYTVPLGNNKFWLEDRVTGIFTNLNTNTYTVTLPSKTYGTGRFFIIASANTPTGIEKPQAEDTGIRVWTSNDKVIIKGEVSDRAICTVYDLRGQKIVETHLNDGELNTVALPYGLQGVYLVHVVDGVKVTTRKVAIL